MPIMIFSGVHAMPKKYSEQVWKQVHGHGVLFSLHKSYISAARDWLNRNCALHDMSDTEIMFDSGAFTAWTKGEPPLTASELGKLYQHMALAAEKRFKDSWFINLDVMPGRPRPVRDKEGKIIMAAGATPQEVADAVKQSDVNYEILNRMMPGRILPVCHRGESFARLREIQDMNPDYVCLSPLVRTPEDIRTDWSLMAEDHMRGRNPKTATHGLATTGATIMQTVNWRSVDSTAWIFNAAMGIIFLDYEGRFLRLPVSRFIRQRRSGGAHAESVEDKRLYAEIERLAMQRGFDMDTLLDARHVKPLEDFDDEMHRDVAEFEREMRRRRRGPPTHNKNHDPGYMARRLFNMQTMAEWSQRPHLPVTEPQNGATRSIGYPQSLFGIGHPE